MKIMKRFLLPASVVVLLGTAAAGASERYFEIARNLDIFATLFKEVNTYYVDEVHPSTLIKTGIDAMLASLDPYTNYIPEDEIEDYRTMTTGQYGGIGAVIGKRGNKTLVLMLYEEYPAHQAGLRIGDEITEVDGVDVAGKSSGEVSKLLKGQANTVIALTVRRYQAPAPQTIRVTRQKIKINNVPYYGMVNRDVGYLHLTDFTSDASREVKKAIVDLKEQGARKVIFDLRDNPGGLLSEAVNIANLFVPKDADVVSTKGKVTEWNKTYRALNQPVDLDLPLVVLTSAHSASASEIVAGVIQDYDRGVLVGERTYGKGLVQATRPLTYNSQLKITTAKYYIPSGRCIQAIDYSHRDEDGSAAKIADSLRVAFKTSSGRVVYDGGGIQPDVEVEQRIYAPITNSLVNKGLIFDYATRFAAGRASIDEPKTFALTVQQYDAFVAWLADKDYDYSTKVEATLAELETNARREKYYDAIKQELTALRTQVSHDKNKDLIKNRDEIRELLEQEIVSRYYLQRGTVEASFDDDPDILAALQVLNDQNTFAKLLRP